MQKIIFAALALSSGQNIHAQAPTKEGKIIYERKVNVHRRMTDESMKSMIPEFNISKTELDFSAEESIYKNIKEEEDIRDHAGEDNNRVIMRIGGGDDRVYKNYTSEKITEQRELGPKKYLIEDSLPRQSWKFQDETKTIKGYACKKAVTHNREGKEVVAWYCEDILSPSGPEGYGGLPGLILELNSNDAEVVFSPLDIITKDFDKKIVKAPTEGKKISRKEFQQMLTDQFGANPNGGPTIRIIRN
ncbi:MAG TPA: GLPGLI family protein [Puia sp.]|nr:GLPGLI family protein [Puia sp.]